MKKSVVVATIIGITAAGAAHAVTVSTYIPGVTNPSSPGGLVGGIYNFALLASGILAFGAIVWGGIRYITSAGNPSGQGEGKEWVKGAIYGLLLLVGAYAILNIINPAITSLSLPRLSPIPASQQIEDRSACSACTSSQVCMKPNGSSVWKCVDKNQQVQGSCDPDPAKSYPANGCTSDKPSCSVNIRTNMASCS